MTFMLKLKNLYILGGFILVLLFALVEFGPFKAQRNSGSIAPNATTAAATGNFSNTGNIFFQQPQRGELKGLWKFVTQNSNLEVKLILTPQSKCLLNSKQFICAESMLSNGEKAVVKGNRNGNSLIVDNLSRIE